jgi:hypothetical protein
MNEAEFIKTMQEKVAVSAVGPSALRGQGKGVLYATQSVLRHIDLSVMLMGKQDDFYNWLDQQTKVILNAMPVDNNPWGAARKALNLFLRDTLYNRYLCEKYLINKVEKWLEIPLYSAVAKGLKYNDTNLPQWPRLKYLRKDISDKFQVVASRLAVEKEIARVHLDMIFWLENR